MLNKHFIPLVISVLLFSCRKEEQSPLAGCCDNPAIDEIVGNGHVYAPNIFTPNNDGINDAFYLSGDSIEQIILMEVRNKENEVVFSASNIIAGMEQNGWNGEVNGEVVKGLYNVTFEVETTDGTIKTLHGKVCNHSCEDSGTNQLNTGACQYPSQNDGGQFNPNFPSGECCDCFE